MQSNRQMQTMARQSQHRGPFQMLRPFMNASFQRQVSPIPPTRSVVEEIPPPTRSVGVKNIRVYEARTGYRCNAYFVPESSIMGVSREDLQEMVNRIVEDDVEIEEIPIHRRGVRIPLYAEQVCIGHVVFSL